MQPQVAEGLVLSRQCVISRQAGIWCQVGTQARRAMRQVQHGAMKQPGRDRAQRGNPSNR